MMLYGYQSIIQFSCVTYGSLSRLAGKSHTDVTSATHTAAVKVVTGVPDHMSHSNTFDKTQ